MEYWIVKKSAFGPGGERWWHVVDLTTNEIVAKGLGSW